MATIRHLRFLLALFLLIGAMPTLARAAACAMLAGETVTFIAPYSPGGGYDLTTRLLEPDLDRQTGAEVVVSDVTGAAGMVGAKTIGDAKPDGRTIGMGGGQNLFLQTLLGNSVTPDLLTDHVVLGQVARESRLLIVAADSPLRRVEDLWSGTPARRQVIGLAGAEGARLLGVDFDLAAAYRGSREVEPTAQVLGRYGEIQGSASWIVPILKNAQESIRS